MVGRCDDSYINLLIRKQVPVISVDAGIVSRLFFHAVLRGGKIAFIHIAQGHYLALATSHGFA